MSVTIKDVARAAKVSVATVSRALNGHDNVAEAVRRRVLAVAHELRYSPHHAARSLSSRRTHTLGVVLPELHGEFFSELLRGIDQVARERNLHLLVSSYHSHVSEQAAALRTMRGRVDGLVVMTSFVGESDHLGENLAALPAVLVNSRPMGGEATVLAMDNYGGARSMMDHLFDSGYRHIAFLDGPADHFDAHERRRGYLDALAQHRPGAAPWILEGDFSEASGHARGMALLQGGNLPDAVFAANDMSALGCLLALQHAGIDIPGQVALAGFDDIPMARLVRPGLTTVRAHIDTLGEQAARLLLAMIEGEEPVEQDVRVATDLVIRDSTRRRD